MVVSGVGSRDGIRSQVGINEPVNGWWVLHLGLISFKPLAGFEAIRIGFKVVGPAGFRIKKRSKGF